jgi:predicted CXXCH cytochrome family protein
VSDGLDSIFYEDGTVRVGGRELNGLTRSACFERGVGSRQLGCLSCHRLHGGSRDDQLDPAQPTDAACASCHESIAAATVEHAHHAPGSPGSSCINCHMPHTSYALFKAIRSHRITSPSARRSRDQKVPNACNLCHIDRGLGWTAHFLSTWYGQPGLEPPAPERPGEAPRAVVDRSRHEWSAAGTDLLAGDAALRVIAADQMGRAEVAPPVDALLRAQLLARALDDPYAAVRFVAGRSLSRQAGFEDFDGDFLAPAPERRLASEAAGARARRASPSPVDPALLEALTRARDPRPVRIAE